MLLLLDIVDGVIDGIIGGMVTMVFIDELVNKA